MTKIGSTGAADKHQVAPLARVLHLIDPPDRRGSLSAVFATLPQILPLLDRLADTPSWLIDGIKLVPGSKASPKRANEANQSSDRQLRGWITEHPVFAALWHQPTQEIADVALRSQAIFLVATCLLPVKNRNSFASTIREAGLCVRRIFANGDLRRVAETCIPASLGNLTLVKMNIDESLKSVPDTQVEAIRLFRGLSRLIAFATNTAKPRQRRHVGDSSRRGIPREYEPDSTFQASKLAVNRLDSRDRSQRIQAGAAPIREAPARTHVAITLKHQTPSERERVIQAKTRLRAMTTAAQQLPFASDRLQLLDIESLTHWLLINQNVKKQQLAVLLLTAMVLAGLDIESAKKIKVFASPPTDTEIDSPILVLEPLSWCLPAPKLKDAYTPPEQARSHFRRPSQWLAIPIPVNFPGVDPLTKAARKLIGGHLFSGTSYHLARKLTVIFQQLNSKTGSRLTLKRVSSFIERMVADTTKDQADGAFFRFAKTRAARQHACITIAQWRITWSILISVYGQKHSSTPSCTGPGSQATLVMTLFISGVLAALPTNLLIKHLALLSSERLGSLVVGGENLAL
ncbi:MAG: hypothetical protein ACRETO_08990 [Gammaproteobacteria bacterium]